MGLYKIFEEGMSEMKKNSPLVLTGLACFGVVTTSIVSIFAGKKLQKKDEIVKKKIEEKKAAGEIVTKRESIVLHVKEKWPALMPVVIGAGVTCYCTIKSYKISAKKIAGLTTALTATSQAFESYKKATKKLLGEKEQDIQREKMKQDVLNNPANPEDEKKFLEMKNQQVANNQFNGIEEWWEPLTQQRIYCTAADITRAFEEISYRVKNRDEDFVEFLDFLYALSKYSQGTIKYDRPEVTEAGWSYDRWNRGIAYDLNTNIGVRVDGRFIPQICYRANWQVSQNEIDFMP